MKPIAEHWNEYAAEVIPKDAPDVQVQECRRAFYAGAKAAYVAALSVGADDISEEQGEDILRAIDAELGQTLLLAWSGETFLLSAAPIWVQPIVIAVTVNPFLEEPVQ